MVTPIKLFGLVGKPCSGKDTIAAYLVERHGFEHVSTGDIIRFHIVENGLGELTRPLMQRVANELREVHGPDYLIRLALQTHAGAQRLVLSGIRAVAEAEAIRQAGTLIAIEAPIRLRYERMVERGRASDHISFEQFKVQEEAEDQNENNAAQNVLAGIALAEVTLTNVGDLDHLQGQVESMLINRV